MSIQPWSMPGSTQTSVGRPWTGIAIGQDGVPFVVYSDGVWRGDANPKLAELAKERGGRLIASTMGWISSKSILAT